MLQYSEKKGIRLRSYKKGGLVHKTGPAMLHKGELVVPKHKVDSWLMSDTGVVGARYSKSTDSEN